MLKQRKYGNCSIKSAPDKPMELAEGTWDIRVNGRWLCRDWGRDDAWHTKDGAAETDFYPVMVINAERGGTGHIIYCTKIIYHDECWTEVVKANADGSNSVRVRTLGRVTIY